MSKAKKSKSSFKSFNDIDNSHHYTRKIKTSFKNKSFKSMDNILKTRDVTRILTLQEKF